MRLSKKENKRKSMKNIKVADLGRPIAVGQDSHVYRFPWVTQRLLKVYYNLYPDEVRRYHAIHAKYGWRWEAVVWIDELFRRFQEKRWFEYTFLWKQIQWLVVRVLELSRDSVEENGEYTLTSIPYVEWINFLDHWGNGVFQSDGNRDASVDITFHMIEHMVHSWLERLWVVFQKNEPKTHKVLQVGHALWRENIMIEWIDNRGIIQATVTDLGISIREALSVETILYWQS